ncbi:MAG TPA: RNA polymerase factor sigma-54 [Candidatus Binataceae bacterium]|jgi:RNA polymerase sigma-54 factor|nr:RNA polymerase factor sigma-54 [Candidatus Binataceae bacterium]
MAMEAKLGQELRLRQQLVMTPQLQQAIKILQLAVPDLEIVVQAELEQNPMLEMAEPSSGEGSLESVTPSADGAAANGNGNGEQSEETGMASEVEAPLAAPVAESHDAAVEIRELNTLDKIDWREYLENYSNNWQDNPADSDDEDRRPAVENTLSRKTSLEDHLMWQLRLSPLSEDEKRIGATIIYNLNDDGYLETPLEDLAAQLESDVAAVEKVLRRVQRLDPPGVAARELKECLLLQLANLGMEDSLAAQIIRSHLGLLEKHRYAEIAKSTGVSVQTVSQAAKVISLLEPKPAREYGGQEAAYIVPDVIIHKMGDEYVVALNEEAVPRLRLSGYYQRVLHDVDATAETKGYLQERLRSAQWLVKSIYQRQQTIYKVATSIVKFQREFFDHGISNLRHLVLKDVADDIGMHESTISRATANKYAHTPQGTFELKFFFTSSVKGAGGEDVSAETVKEKIRRLVAGENHGDPLSDQALAEILRRDQINIARRTVAKYRQALGILPSARRKLID